MNSTIAGLTLAAAVFVGVPYASIALSEKVTKGSVVASPVVASVRLTSVHEHQGEDGSAAALIDGRSRSLSPSMTFGNSQSIIKVPYGSPTTARSALEAPTESQDRPLAVDSTSRPLSPIPTRVNVEAVIRQAAVSQGVNADLFLKIGWCESKYNPSALNPVSGAAGLFQHIETTWVANSRRYGWTGASPFNPEASANVAAAMIAHGNIGAWDASRKCWDQ